MIDQKKIVIFLMLIIFLLICYTVKFQVTRDIQTGIKQEIQYQKDLREHIENYNKKHQEFLETMKEFENVSYKIHALIFKPKSSNLPTYLPTMKKCNWNRVKNKKERHQQHAPWKNPHLAEYLACLFLLVLFLSLIKSIVDISDDFRKRKEKEEDTNRRLSLQEYAATKSEMKNGRASLIWPSTLDNTDIRPKYANRYFEERRISRGTVDISHSSLLSNFNRMDTVSIDKPPSLLRRCSVSSFVPQNTGYPSFARRQSVDSLSEDDSSPEVKRRVRIIHRH